MNLWGTAAMWSSKGSVAVITGGGGLLGRGMALTFAEAGMDVVVADIRLDAARSVAAEVEARGRRGLAVETDVSNPASVTALAEAAYGAFGKVNLVCNNAGGALLKPVWAYSLDDWNRMIGSNLMGVIHGVHEFLPRMMKQDGPRHIVNTASMSGVGLASLRELNAIYVTCKFAVVGLTETLRPSIAAHGIGASVLCPGMTVAEPSKPMEFRMPSAEWYKDNLLDNFDVGREVLRAVEENRLHIFPHREGLGEVEARHELLMESFRQAAATAPPLGAHPRG
jgi:NAD(P)-dependent dehydrogenase (short-subunit alcohol dehydrogenase family)